MISGKIADIQYGIVGAGQLSTAFAVSLGYAVVWIANRGEERRSKVRTLFGEMPVYSSVEQVQTPPDCILLAVADSAVQQQAELCAKHWGTALQGRYVLHCSGALGRDVLESCRKSGARSIAVHPFQTITASSIPAGAAWGIEADPDDEEFARRFVEFFGGIPFLLSEETQRHRALYHASASVAANYLTVLAACAADLAAVAGIPASLFLPPIMRTALENALVAIEDGRALPLTGPIARADIGTLAKQIDELHNHPHLLREYCLFGIAATELAARHGTIGSEARNAILSIFYAESGGSHAAP